MKISQSNILDFLLSFECRRFICVVDFDKVVQHWPSWGQERADYNSRASWDSSPNWRNLDSTVIMACLQTRCFGNFALGELGRKPFGLRINCASMRSWLLERERCGGNGRQDMQCINWDSVPVECVTGQYSPNDKQVPCIPFRCLFSGELLEYYHETDKLVGFASSTLEFLDGKWRSHCWETCL